MQAAKALAAGRGCGLLAMRHHHYGSNMRAPSAATSAAKSAF
jgi:hypothetical protein